jgi:hypothetical protein
VDNIKIDLGEIGWGGMDWIGLAQGRDQWKALVNAVMNLRGFIKCWMVHEWLHNWRPQAPGVSSRSMDYVPIFQPIIIPGSIEFLVELHSLTIS